MQARRREATGALVVVAAAVFAMLLGGLRERFAQRAGVTPAGQRRAMGDVSLRTLEGGTWRLGEHRGQVVLVNLWATWCGPCREETPMLVRLEREMGPRGLAVVGVSMDVGGRERKVRAFAREFGVGYPMAFADAMSQMSAGMEGIPTTIVVDREGRVARTYVGEVREGVLREDVEVLLSESVIPPL